MDKDYEKIGFMAFQFKQCFKQWEQFEGMMGHWKY